jgi:hypothetical protein
MTTAGAFETRPFGTGVHVLLTGGTGTRFPWALANEQTLEPTDYNAGHAARRMLWPPLTGRTAVAQARYAPLMHRLDYVVRKSPVRIRLEAAILPEWSRPPLPACLRSGYIAAIPS